LQLLNGFPGKMAFGIKNNPEKYSPWCVEETALLIKNKKI